MTDGVRTWPIRPVVLAGLAVALAVVGYNAWSFCCGYCTLETFRSLGGPGWSLLAANAGALSAWLWLRQRSRRLARNAGCACGRPLQSGWRFCPECGHPRHGPSTRK